ncbi:MAG: hypothetical protein ABR511_00515 [Acidimicrobiales bacterium]
MDGDLAAAGGDPMPIRGVPPELHVDVVAALVRRQAADTARLLDFVATRLGGALPGAVAVSHRGLLGTGRVSSVRVTLPGVELELAAGPGGTVAATVGRSVGGVVLRHDPVTVDEWVDHLVTALVEVAGRSEAANAALAALVR